MPFKENQDIINLIKIVNDKGYICEPTDDGLFIIRDKYSATFFFKVTGAKLNLNGMQEALFAFIYFPASNIDRTTANFPNTYLEQLLERLDGWITLTEAYEKTTFYKDLLVVKEDQILKKYAEEAFEELKFVDVDADTQSFPINIQLELDEYIEKTVKLLEAHQKKIQDNPHKQELLTEVIQDFNILRDTQTEQTKNEFLKNLITITAKCRKIGLEAWKVVWPELIKLFMKQIAENNQ